jgi:GNAT superfamily N-acetyltransferase
MDATLIDSVPLIRIRPLAHGEDEPLHAVFAGLSQRSRYLRYHSPLPRLTAPMRRLLTDVDGHRHVALVAELPRRSGWIPLGIGRMIATGDRVAEVAFEVVDEWHGCGVGRRLLSALSQRAQELGYDHVVALVLAENRRALELVRSLFPEVTTRRAGQVLELTGRVRSPVAAAA